MLIKKIKIPEDEISLYELIVFLSKNWKFIFFGGFCGLIAGVAYITFVVVDQYEATAIVQMAKVAGNEVESPSVLMLKHQMMPYFSENTLKKCVAINQNKANLKLEVNNKLNLLTIKYSSKSSNDAIKCLNAALEDIIVIQNTLSYPALELSRKQLIDLLHKLATLDVLIQKSPSDQIYPASTYSTLTSDGLIYLAQLNKQIEVQDLRSKINLLVTNLNYPQTKEAELLAPIFVNTITDIKKIALLAAIFAGIFLSFIFLLVNKWWNILSLQKNQK